MTLTWKIESLNCKPSFDGKTNVVEIIHWRLNGVDGDLSASVYGSVGVTYKDSTSFTEYNNLTEEQLVSWVKDNLEEEQVTDYENGVTSQLELLKNPVVVNPPLPWENSAI
jgi:hypothetical protein